MLQVLFVSHHLYKIPDRIYTTLDSYIEVSSVGTLLAENVTRLS